MSDHAEERRTERLRRDLFALCARLEGAPCGEGRETPPGGADTEPKQTPFYPRRSGGWRLEPATSRITLTDEMARLAGDELTPTAVDLDALFGLLPPSDRAHLLHTLRAATTKPTTIELHTLGVPGPERWFDVTVQLHPGAHDQDGCVIGRYVDVTERKRIEVELRESEQRFRELFNLLPASISFTRKSDHVFLEVNQGFVEGSGLSREMVLGRSARELDLGTSPDERAALLDLLDTQGDVKHYEVSARTADGRALQLSFSAASVIVGNEPGWLSVLTDVTALREAEEALRENERRLQLLVENSSDILGVADTHSVFVSLRGPVQRILGYQPEELIGKVGFDYLHPDDLPQARQVFDELLTSPGLTRHAEFRFRHGQGHFIEVEASGTNRLHEPGITGLVLAIREISQRKEAERERTRLQEQLQQAMKMEAVGRLAGGVAHDFNNLLTAISGNLELAKLEVDPLHPLSQYLAEASHAVALAAEVTHQLLIFSRRQVIAPRNIDLNQLLTTLRKMLARLIGEHIRLETRLADHLGTVQADPGQFQQLVVNLCVNARDAMPEGGRLEIATANTEFSEEQCRSRPDLAPGRYVQLTVTDTGHGMTDEVRQRIFEPFFTTKGEGQGTGLGLAMVFGAVRQAQGSIEVDSELGAGTTFRILLPRIDEPVETLRGEPPCCELPHGNEVVLLVEDNPSVRELSVKMLTRLGYRVHSATEGYSALQLAEQNQAPLDLLLTDVVMPGMSGRELADRVKRLHPKAAVLFTSGYTDDMVILHGVRNQAVHYIGKPYSLQSLAQKVRQVLDGRDRERA